MTRILALALMLSFAMPAAVVGTDANTCVEQRAIATRWFETRGDKSLAWYRAHPARTRTIVRLLEGWYCPARKTPHQPARKAPNPPGLPSVDGTRKTPR